MTDFSQITIKNKQRNKIIKSANFNVKKDITSTINHKGENETVIKVLNPEQMEENLDKAEILLLETFYPDITNWDDLPFQEYDKYKKELMDFITENQDVYAWVIDLKLCPEHQKISEDNEKKRLKEDS